MSSNDFSLHFVPFIFRYNVRPNNFCSALLVAANIVLVPTASTTATYHRSFLFALCFFLKNDICVELSYCSVFVRLASSSNVVRNLCIESLPIAYRPTWLMKTLFSVFRNLEIPLDGQTQQALLLYLCTHVCDTSANMEATRYADVRREMARSKSGPNKRMNNRLISIFFFPSLFWPTLTDTADCGHTLSSTFGRIQLFSSVGRLPWRSFLSFPRRPVIICKSEYSPSQVESWPSPPVRAKKLKKKMAKANWRDVTETKWHKNITHTCV